MSHRPMLDRFVRTTRMSIGGIRAAFILALLYLLITTYVVTSFLAFPATTDAGDWIYLAVIWCLVGPLAIILGWLGFSRRGVGIVNRALAHPPKKNSRYHIGESLFGAVGLAGIPWMLLFVGSSMVGDERFARLLFHPLVIALLVLLCLPISHRYMK